MSKADSSLESSSLLPEILFWLWDIERSRKPHVTPCLILVTENVGYGSFFQKFRERRSILSSDTFSRLSSVHVVSVTGFIPHSGHKIFEEITANCDAVIEQRTLIHHTNLLVCGDYQSVKEVAVLCIHPFLSKLEAKRDRKPSSSFHLPAENRFQHDDGSGASLIDTLFKTTTNGLLNVNVGTSATPQQDSVHFPSLVNFDGDGDATTAELYAHYLPSSGYEESHGRDDLYSDYLDHYQDVGDKLINQQQHQSHSHLPLPAAFDSFTPEHHQLQDDLTHGIYSSNVKLTVTTLRKMYTKQTKTFRIPLVLSVVLPDTSAMALNGRIDLINIALCFILDCIQWCFGVQKGENFESFKYKMNANIARWLLKESVRKGIPSPVSSAVSNSTLKLMSQILENYLELNFVYELLQSMHISEPIYRMVPYVHHWLTVTATIPGSMHTRVHEFLYAHPEFSHALSAAPNPDFSFSPSQTIASFHSEDNSAADHMLVTRLLNLLKKSVNGELGARIPTLYRDEYGEPLRLKGRKLKDILIGPSSFLSSHLLSSLCLTETGKVDVYGCDGPGDKLFRLIPSLMSPHAQRSFFGQSSAPSYQVPSPHLSRPSLACSPFLGLFFGTIRSWLW
jgi:hypothetical protein